MPNESLAKQETKAIQLTSLSQDLVPTLINSITDVSLVIEIESGLSVVKTLEASPIVMQVKAHGRASVARALDILITRLALMMNVKHNITPAQMTTIVYDLLELYPNETLEDFTLVFKRMRQDYYGPNYHQVSESTIVACMKMHLEEKWAEKERILKKERDELERRDILNKTNSLTTEQILKEYQRIAKEGPQPDKPKDKKHTEEFLEFRENYLRKKLIDEQPPQQLTDGNQTENEIKEPEGGPADTTDQGNPQS